MMAEFGRKADIAIGPITNCERLQDLLQNIICASLSISFSKKTRGSISRSNSRYCVSLRVYIDSAQRRVPAVHIDVQASNSLNPVC